MSIELNLAAVVIPTKKAEVEFPGYPDLKLTLNYLSREEINKIRKKATKTKYDRKTRTPIEEVDDELFLSLYVGSILAGWTGMKVSYLAQFMPMDTSGVTDMAAEVTYTPENALVLMKNSPEFDSYVTDTVSDLQNFTKSSSK